MEKILTMLKTALKLPVTSTLDNVAAALMTFTAKVEDVAGKVTTLSASGSEVRARKSEVRRTDDARRNR